MNIFIWLLIRLFINAGALFLVAQYVEGVVLASFSVALLAALILGIVNAVLRPILLLLTLPVNLLTLGIFGFVVNAGMLLLVASVVKGFVIEGFVSALVAAVILWLVSLISNIFFRGS